MFLGMRKGLKSIDFYQAVESEHSQGTVSGACISIVFISFILLMVFMTVQEFLQPRSKSDLIIDQQHLNEPLRVNIDIEFPRYACSMLSLDVENVLKVHKVNIGETVKKYEMPGNILYNDKNMTHDEKKARILSDFKGGKGCRMTGWFEVDRVPGNFHFSCHGYSQIMQEFINEGTYRMAHKKIDMTHIIHQLNFGLDADQTRLYSNALRNFHSEKEIKQAFLGISYTYFLDIVEENSFDGEEASERYFYTARLNEVILATAPLVYFRYETNPMTAIRILEHQEWHRLFVELVGLIGGVFTIAAVIDLFVHSSIHFLLEKKRLGKLR